MARRIQEPATNDIPLIRTQNARIVVVDRDDAAREDTARLLRTQGWRVAAVRTIDAAHEAIRAESTDLLLADVLPPALDGLELIQAVRANVNTGDLPVILLATEPHEDAAISGLALGAVDYLVKPYVDRELVARVDARIRFARARSQIAAGLAESETRFRNMADHAPVMLWMTRADGYCTFLNQRWYDYTGQTPATGLGYGWLDAVHPDDAAGAGAVFLEANKRREAFRLDYRLRRKDGVYRWAIDAATPRFAPNGEYLGYLGSVIDIDERRTMEEALRRSEERHRRIFNSVAVSIWDEDFSAVKVELDALKAQGVTDIRAYLREHPEFVQRAVGLVKISDVNDATVAMFKARDKTQLLESLDRIFLPETAPVFAEEIAAIFENRTRMDSEAPLRTLEGEQLNVTFSMIFDTADPELRSTLVSLVDTTARARAEAALRQAKIEAETANKAKSEFLASMSHELRTPLNAILGYAELMEEGVHGPITDEQREALGRVRRSGQHLLRLITDVLGFAKLEAGAVSYDIARVRVDTLLASLEPLVAPQMQRQGLRFEVGTCAPTIAVRADAEKVTQILVNLLTNAIKHTERDGDISVSCEPDERMARIHVRDTGSGISPDRLQSIFEPFVQADRRFDQPREGVGLGLTISRDMARAMGGEISVTSAVGKGSTFTLSLPLDGAGAR